jgi:DnaJ-class molecular chaperone
MEEKFKIISQAYDVLKDESSRKTYDALKHEFKNGGPK